MEYAAELELRRQQLQDFKAEKVKEEEDAMSMIGTG